MDKAKFATEVISRFKTVRPEWQPPHKTIFAIAKKHRLTALINGKDETWWRKNIEELFEKDSNGWLDKPKVKLNGDTIVFEWLDCRKLKLKSSAR